MNKPSIIALCAAFALPAAMTPALAQPKGQTPAGSPSGSQMNNPGSAAPPSGQMNSTGAQPGVNSAAVAPSTAEFVQKVAGSDMFEIQSSQLAAQKATDDATKNFARQMVADHTKTTNELKSMMQNGSVKATAPKAMDAAHQKMVDRLKAAKGQEFTRQYRADQVTAHTEAVALFQRYAQSGDNAALRDWASRTLPTLQHHLEMAQSLDKQS